MKLPYTAEAIKNPEGIPCRVLDRSGLDFSTAETGRKSAETLVKRASGGELIETRNAEGKLETSYTAQAGDAIFCNLHDEKDVYVPGKPDGTRWKFDALREMGYEIANGTLQSGQVRVKNASAFKILHEVVDDDICIKDAWGKGQHQFLYKGASLKLNANGMVTGIDKSAFDATWEIIPPPANPSTLKKPGF
jgi:hypothetical protein